MPVSVRHQGPGFSPGTRFLSRDLLPASIPSSTAEPSRLSTPDHPHEGQAGLPLETPAHRGTLRWDVASWARWELLGGHPPPGMHGEPRCTGHCRGTGSACPAAVLQPDYLPPPGLAGGARCDARFVPWPRGGGCVRGHPSSSPHLISPLGPSSPQGSRELAGSIFPVCSLWTRRGSRSGRTHPTAPASAAPRSIPGQPGGCSLSSATLDGDTTSLVPWSQQILP